MHHPITDGQRLELIASTLVGVVCIAIGRQLEGSIKWLCDAMMALILIASFVVLSGCVSSEQIQAMNVREQARYCATKPNSIARQVQGSTIMTLGSVPQPCEGE